MITIYVLRCTNNKYYIGKTLSSVSKRFNIHKKGQGAIWTKKYRPIEILKTYQNCDHFDEDKYTKMYMDKFGIDNVRGGSYTKVNLENNIIKFLKKELSSIHDKCYGCGAKNHFIKNCPNKYLSDNEYDSSSSEYSTDSDINYDSDTSNTSNTSTRSTSSYNSTNSYYNI